MDRRNAFSAFAAAAAGLFVARAAKAEPEHAGRVVYHLADVDKAAFVLGNLENHLAGAPGVKLAVVVHGPALKAFLKEAPNRAIVITTQERLKAGVAFVACGHTMSAQNWTLADLTPGFTVAEQGGVVRLADLQAQGWAYLRP